MQIKKNYVIILMVLIFFLIGCQYSNIEQGKSKFSVENKPTNTQVVTPTKLPISTPINTLKELNEIATKDLKIYLTSTREDILKLFNNNYVTGTSSLIESHMIFPFIYYKDKGLSFIFINEDKSDKPKYVLIDATTNITNLNIRAGMLFKDIIKTLGNKKVNKTWVSSEDIDVYEINYNFEGLNLMFVSNSEDGLSSELYISLLSD